MAFNFFKKSKEDPKNLKEVLVTLRDFKKKIEKLSRDLDNLKEENKYSLQKVGIVRFNPFPEVGGNQSFSIALLNDNNDGVVITSLYSREENRVYGKPIKNGISEYLLSKEEKIAIKKAINKNEKDNPPVGGKKIKGSASSSGGLGTH